MKPNVPNCGWLTHGRQCQMPGTIGTTRPLCAWHYATRTAPEDGTNKALFAKRFPWMPLPGALERAEELWLRTQGLWQLER